MSRCTRARASFNSEPAWIVCECGHGPNAHGGYEGCIVCFIDRLAEKLREAMT